MHLVKRRLDSPHLTRPGHLPALPVELDAHRVEAVEIRVHGKAHPVLLAMGRLVGGVGLEGTHVAVPDADWALVQMRRLALHAPGAPFGVCLARLFVVGPGELLAGPDVVEMPVAVVSQHIWCDALIALGACPGQAHVLGDEGGVGVVVVVFVLEDVGLFVLPFLFHVFGFVTVAEG